MTSTTDTPALSTAAEKRSAYLAGLLNLAKRSQTDSTWLRQLRDHAAVRVQEQSFPTTRDEAWRFTDLSELLQFQLSGITEPAVELSLEEIEPFILPEAAQSRLVFVNGIYAPQLSRLEGLSNLVVGNLKTLAAQEDLRHRLQPYLGRQAGAEEVFTALNTAGLSDAAVVWVPRNREIAPPLHLLFVATASQTPTFAQPRALVIADTSSSVTLVEEYVTIDEGAYFNNAVTEIWVADNAQVNHTRVQREGQAVFHIGKTAVSQARSSRYTCNAISLGAKLSRHHLEIYQTGEQTETTLNGLTMLSGEQIGDLHSAIALSQPYGVTRQLHKCIVDDRAHSIFNGKVFVPQKAQLTDAGQLNRNLLLSSKARVDTKPQLEIVADNVKCSHGATVGQLEEDEVFYLQSRGIDAASARTLLVYAFAYEVIEQVAIDSLKESLSQFVSAQAH
ncbi:Fe-S cluster assembly protein SufD [Phormidium tenue FACHB-886]|nr:Fe-S cluster assembly protein SufD [Phormidium tenue FACHB-886]